MALEVRKWFIGQIVHIIAMSVKDVEIEEGTQDDRGRDGGTNFILRIKEQETRLNLHEHDDDDDDDDDEIVGHKEWIFD